MDVSTLSKDEKLKLLDAVREKKRRARKKGAVYAPNKPQLEAHKSQALERYLFWGNGTGKSCWLSNEMHWAATGYNPIQDRKTPVPAKVILLLDNPSKINDILGEYAKWHPMDELELMKAGKPEISQINFPNGSIVTVLSHQVEPLRLEGIELTHLLMDEPPPREVFNALYRGGRIKGSPLKIALAGTPITQAWLRQEIYEPWSRGELDYVECFRGHSSQNKQNLDPQWLERFSARLTEEEKRVRLHGDFFDLSGQALAHLFHRETHIIRNLDLDRYWSDANPCVIALDPHPSKNHVACIMGADENNYLYYLDELSLKKEPREFARIIKDRWMEKYRVVDVICDSAGMTDYSGGEGFSSFIEVLRDEGIPVRSTNYDDKLDEHFIERVRDALVIPLEEDNFGQKIPKLRFLEGNNGILFDVENVGWQRDKRTGINKPKLEIAKHDFLACVKYALASGLHHSKGRNRIYKRKMPGTYGHSNRKTANFYRKRYGLRG